jgi:hypothetical protein
LLTAPAPFGAIALAEERRGHERSRRLTHARCEGVVIARCAAGSSSVVLIGSLGREKEEEECSLTSCGGEI